MKLTSWPYNKYIILFLKSFGVFLAHITCCWDSYVYFSVLFRWWYSMHFFQNGYNSYWWNQLDVGCCNVRTALRCICYSTGYHHHDKETIAIPWLRYYIGTGIHSFQTHACPDKELSTYYEGTCLNVICIKFNIRPILPIQKLFYSEIMTIVYKLMHLQLRSFFLYYCFLLCMLSTMFYFMCVYFLWNITVPWCRRFILAVHYI